MGRYQWGLGSVNLEGGFVCSYIVADINLFNLADGAVIKKAKKYPKIIVVTLMQISYFISTGNAHQR